MPTYNSSASIGGRAPSLPHNRLALPANVSPRCFHTGGVPAAAAADFTNSTPVITELYVAEIFVPSSCTVRGIAVFNGSVASDNLKVGLYDAGGTLLASSASTAGNTTADSYQLIPFANEFLTSITGAATALTAATGQLVLNGGTYYVGCIFDGTTSRFNTHAVGSFGGGKITGLVYAAALSTTALTIAPPTTFTAASLPPVASLY